jgi:hypothetical protein
MRVFVGAALVALTKREMVSKDRTREAVRLIT